MDKLNNGVRNYYKGKEKSYNVNQFIFSGSDEPGEGEHKLFQHIRDNEFQHKNK